jgi:hypothetical protein
MIAKKITVLFFAGESGAEPVREWLLGLDKADRVRVGDDIRTVEFGWPIGMPVLPPARQRALRGENQFKEQDRARALCHRGWRHGAAARVHQEIANHAQGRSGNRADAACGVQTE